MEYKIYTTAMSEYLVYTLSPLYAILGQPYCGLYYVIDLVSVCKPNILPHNVGC